MDPVDPIQHDELVIRRLTPDKMSLDQKRALHNAFAPHERDIDGLSVHRAKYHSPKEVGQDLRRAGSQPGWVVTLRVADIQALGIEVVPDPQPGQVGHALLKTLTAANRHDDRTESLKRALADLVVELIGPFPPPGQAK